MTKGCHVIGHVSCTGVPNSTSKRSGSVNKGLICDVIMNFLCEQS